MNACTNGSGYETVSANGCQKYRLLFINRLVWQDSSVNKAI
jgi:hypothetical protein